MSDEPTPDLDTLNAARQEIAEALGRYADGWSSTEGGIVTAFVVLAEVATPDGYKALLEVRGAGLTGSDNMPTWLRDGMLFNAMREEK